MSAEFKEKIRSLSLVSRATPSKVTVDHTDTAIVTTTTTDDRQDVNVAINEPISPHWKEES